jgi:hypothetical protein
MHNLGQPRTEDFVLSFQVTNLANQIRPVGVGRQQQQWVDESAHVAKVNRHVRKLLQITVFAHR